MKDQMTNEDLVQLQNSIGYYFNDIELLETALTHSSYANENKLHISKCNERLEFLGDTVINLVVSEYLYNKYPFYPEGELTKIRAKVVCEPSLAFIARNLQLGNYIFLGKGEESTGGRNRESILADASEALTGAIFLDSSYEVVKNYLLESFEAEIVHSVAKEIFSLIIRLNFRKGFRRLQERRWNIL